jgi:4-amino-4-deoxy-L-arabinose transferase-like glycosyltransferase
MFRQPGLGWRQWILVGILLLAFVLRLGRLGAESLWYDETVSLHLASKSPSALVAHTAGDIHPPGYYLLLHGWTRLCGSSEFSAAMLSVVFGMLLVALAHRLAARVFGRQAGLAAAFLVAISPYHVWYAQEVRMYTLGAALGVGLLAASMAMLRPREPGRRPTGWSCATYVLCGALGLWVLYYFAFLLLAVNLLAGLWWITDRLQHRASGRWLGPWALAQGAVLLLYAPWLPIAWRQATQPPVPPWRGFVALDRVVIETWSSLSLGQSADPAQVWPVLVLIAALFALGLSSRAPAWPRSRRQACLLAGTLFLPVLLIYLASIITPLYHVRYAFTYAMPFYVILAGGLVALLQRWRPAFWAGLAAIAVFSALSIRAYHSDPRYTADDHRAAVGFLADQWRPGDAILVNAGYTYPALLTYWDGDPLAWRGRLVGDPAGDPAAAGGLGPVMVQTGTVDGPASLGWGQPTSDFYAMGQAEAAEALARLFGAFDRVWVYRCYDTVTDPGGFLRGWLHEHGLLFEERTFSGESQLRVQGFLAERDPLDGMQQRHDFAFVDGALRLVGSAAPSAVAPVGGSLDLALTWRVNASPAGDPILFAGLFGAGGLRWAQVDARPLGSRYRVADWPVGSQVRTPLRIELPPGMPPGRYSLEVGWYRFEAGQPVWLGERPVLLEVEAVAPDNWWSLPPPAATHRAGVTIGPDVELLGFDAPPLTVQPGEELPIDLVWRALADAPDAGLIVLQLTGEGGEVRVESTATPVLGRVPFAQLSAGQPLRDPHSMAIPGDATPGVYDLLVGRRRPDGTWLPVHRGPVPLGATYPLATIRILGRSVNRTPPAVGRPLEARLGSVVRFLGYDRQLAVPQHTLVVTLHWQAVAPTDTPFKLFVHLIGEGGPADIRAQSDRQPQVPTTGWVAGEYLSEGLTLDLPADLAPGEYALLAGFYDEATGARLPVYVGDEAVGDSLELDRVLLGQ